MEQVQFTKSGGITLALGGGAALGWAHIGVLRALDEAGISPGAIAGTSVGALVGASYLAGKLDDLEEIARSADWLRVLRFIDLQWHGKGLLGGDLIVKELNQHFGGQLIEGLPAPYAAVSADLVKGEEVVFRDGPVVDAIRASISIPGVFTAPLQGGRFLVDGGMVDPVPVGVARNLSVLPVVAVDITGDYFGQAKSLGISSWAETALLPAVREGQASGPTPLGELAQRLFRRGRQAPNLVSVITASYALMVRQLTQLQLLHAPPDVYIVPKIGHITMMEFGRAAELIDLGYEAAQGKISEIRERAAAAKPVS